MCCNGGGLANFSPNVATVAANAAIGIYNVPKVDVTTVSVHSRAVTAGSMRGYGTLQTMTALEVLVDEMCTALPLDPIEFRRRNALKAGDRTMAGNPTSSRFARRRSWTSWNGTRSGASARKRRRAPETAHVVGTGVACATKDYGTGADCSLAARGNRSARDDRHPHAIMSKWETASARRWPIVSPAIWAEWPTKLRWRRSTRSMRSRS